MKKLASEPHDGWFPYPSDFTIDGELWSAQQVLDTLGPMLAPARRARVDEVARGRSFGIATVVDGLYDRGNISAVMRSAEGLGFSPIHVIESQIRFKKANRVTQGSDKWLDISLWQEPGKCAQHLKGLGYQIVTTHLDAAVPIDEIDFTVPTALVLGNEKQGVSEEMLSYSDHNTIIPMAGFAQSFNISVAAAISLYHIRLARDRAGMHSDLSEEQKRVIQAEYYLRSLGSARAILAAQRKHDNKNAGGA